MDLDKMPFLKVVWDPESQNASVVFKPEEFKSWDFVVGLLTMAKSQAEMFRDLGRAKAMQQQQMEQMQAVAIRNAIKLPR